MADKIFEYHPSDVVSLNIEDFNGPIDTLYQLIVSNEEYGEKYSISTFPLHLVTNQFVVYLSQLDRIDMDVASDFIKIGTVLLKLKAAALARAQTEEIEEEEEDTDESELRRRLEIYKIVQDNVINLKSREKIYRINRKPKFTDADAIIVIDKFNLDALLDAFGVVAMRQEEKKIADGIKSIPKDRYPVSEEALRVTKLVYEKKKVGFYSLFEDHPDKSQVISAFQAILRLVSKQVLLTEQEEGKEIQIKFNPEFDVDGVNLELLAADDQEGINKEDNKEENK